MLRKPLQQYLRFLQLNTELCKQQLKVSKRNIWILRRHIKNTNEGRKNQQYLCEPMLGEELISPYAVGPTLNENPRQVPFRIDQYRRDYIYDEIEDTDAALKENGYWKVKVILLTNVDGLGIVGDVVDIPADEARTKFLCCGKAVYASPYNLEAYKEVIEGQDNSIYRQSSKYSAMTCRHLEKIAIDVVMSSENEWTLQKSHLRVSFRKHGINVPEDAIELPKTLITGPDIAGKNGKDFAVYITINNQERVPVRCCLFHTGQKISQNWYRGERPILLPDEQRDLLTSMYLHPADVEATDEY